MTTPRVAALAIMVALLSAIVAMDATELPTVAAPQARASRLPAGYVHIEAPAAEVMR